jgi:uncharacterized DUF497 family protein
MGLQFDPSKAGENLKKHGVSFADAEGVFYDALAIHRPDTDAENEERFVAVGMGSASQVIGGCLYTAWRRYPVDLGSPRNATRGQGL